MEQSGEHHILAGRLVVWRSLNDPLVLAKCIDGCQSMEHQGDNAYIAVVKAKIGPVSATFKALITLADLKPPESYVIKAEVKGGPAGFAKGTVKVWLDEAEGGALLRYQLNARVGGKLAQIGGRLIDGAARKMANDFFTAFSATLSSSNDATADAKGIGASGGQAGPEPRSDQTRSV